MRIMLPVITCMYVDFAYILNIFMLYNLLIKKDYLTTFT